MARPLETRYDQRSAYDTATRIHLLEDDADDLERKIARFDAKLNGILAGIAGILLTLAVEVAKGIIR